MQAGLSRRFTLISAPAGFGKTTLVSSWLNQQAQGRRKKNETAEVALYPAPPAPGKGVILHPFNVAWVLLDESKDDPVRFWTYVLAAPQNAGVDVAQDALEFFNAAEPPPLETILTLVINQMIARRPPPSCRPRQPTSLPC